MTRATRVHIDLTALIHNLNKVKHEAPGKKVIAMVKANAYGCGLSQVVGALEGEVDAFGVACIEEALAIKKLGSRTDCILFQGIFSEDELHLVAQHGFQCVLHQAHQLQWLIDNPLPKKIKIWIKVNTGMNRLGFAPEEVYEAINALRTCPWVDSAIGLMTHLACADVPEHPANKHQLQLFQTLNLPDVTLIRSIANSAAILSLPDTHADVVRPGIMLYGVSPFSNEVGLEKGLRPVMHFLSAITAIRHYPANAQIGYGGTWQSSKPCIIAIVAAGYGDGYPRHVAQNTPVWVKGCKAPIVGRISMDMITIDITDCPNVAIGDEVELWGQYIPVEVIAAAAGTIGYELLCQFIPRPQGTVQ